MSEQESSFTRNQGRLLDIATWAKYLAWVVLIVFILFSVGKYIEIQNIYNYRYSGLGQSLDIFDDMKNHPLYAMSIIVDVLRICMQGVVFFLVLKAISLGLNMIVETDTNYREHKDQGDE